MRLLSGPELDGRESERQPLRRHGQTRMHRDAATSVVLWAPLVVGTRNTDARPAHRLDTFLFVRELGGVVKHKNRAARRRRSIARRLKVAGEDLRLVD